MPPAAGQPAALQGTEPGQGHLRGESVCLSVGVCEGGGKTTPRERVSRAAAEGRRAECVCEAESELESVTGCRAHPASEATTATCANPQQPK